MAHAWQALCPTHRLAAFLDEKADGETLFPGINAGDALRTLRSLLVGLGIKGGSRYRTHDLRRGHALDLQLSGAHRTVQFCFVVSLC